LQFRKTSCQNLHMFILNRCHGRNSAVNGRNKLRYIILQNLNINPN
jgi:hypothetical protein